MEQNSLRAKLSMTTSELAKIKATEDELYTLKVCVGGILGRELGLGNGQIRNDQIKVSDASSPVLQYPRYIYFIQAQKEKMAFKTPFVSGN